MLLEIVSMLSDGATPDSIARHFGVDRLYAAVLLSRYKREGILLKKKSPNGSRYFVSQKGEKKLKKLKEKIKEGGK